MPLIGIVSEFRLLINHLCRLMLLVLLLCLLVPHLHLYVLDPLLILQLDLLRVHSGASDCRHLAKAHQEAHEDAHEQYQESEDSSAHTVGVSW